MDNLFSIYDSYSGTFAVIGAAFCFVLFIKILLHVLRAVRSFILAPILNLGVDPLKLGSWAVVTGATDGIGKAYAIALAKKGVNVVLVSRTASKLSATADEISAISKVKTKCITADFSGGLEIYQYIERELEGLDVGLLVNNVGMSYEYPEYVHLVTDRDQTFNRLLHINIFSVTFMTTMVLPQMVARNKGAIVNIGSASCFGFPLLSVYAASKAYVDSFSKNLAAEYGDKGIIIQSVIPGFVATNMSGVRRSSLFIPFAKEFVRSAIGTIGVESPTTGYWSHWLMMNMYMLARSVAGMKFYRWIIRTMEKRRDIILKRKAMKKAQ